MDKSKSTQPSLTSTPPISSNGHNFMNPNELQADH